MAAVTPKPVDTTTTQATTTPPAVDTKAADKTSKGYSVAGIVGGALLALGLILGAYIAQTNFQAFSKLGALMSANPLIAAGVLAGIVVVSAASYGIYLLFKPETAEAKQARITGLETALKTADEDVATCTEKKSEADTQLSKAQTALSQAQTAQTENQDDTKKTGFAEAVKTAEGAVKTAETAAADAKAALEAATAKQTAATAALNKAQTPPAKQAEAAKV